MIISDNFVNFRSQLITEALATYGISHDTNQFYCNTFFSQ